MKGESDERENVSYRRSPGRQIYRDGQHSGNFLSPSKCGRQFSPRVDFNPVYCSVRTCSWNGGIVRMTKTSQAMTTFETNMMEKEDGLDNIK